MNKILLLIDKKSDTQYGMSNNWIMYQDNFETVVSSFIYKHNKIAIENDGSEWTSEFQNDIIDFVKSVFNDSISVPSSFDNSNIEYKIFNEEQITFPNASKSFLFTFNDGKDDADYKSVEDRIAGYSIRLMLEDLEYDSCEYYGNTYHGEDFGYTLTDRACCHVQTARINFNWRDSIELKCYCIRNLVVE